MSRRLGFSPLPRTSPASRRRLLRRCSIPGAALLLCGFALFGAGCGKKSTTRPVVELPPPQVLEVFPAARSTRVPYTTPIWARFREPLDPATVSNTTVFLKLDTRRIPMRLTLADSARKVSIEPTAPLGLHRTYTVEFAPGVRTASGSGLGTTYSWQFTIVGVHGIEAPEPDDGAIGESPVAPLFWAPTDSSAGALEYQVFFGADSASVADESAPSVTIGTPYYLPTQPWDHAATVYWKAQVHNLDSGERDTGPVWRFDTAPAGAPIDSVFVRLLDSGYWNGRRWTCPDMITTINSIGIVRFDLSSVDSGLVVASAALLMSTSTIIANQNPRVWVDSRDWFPCDARTSGFPPVLWYGYTGHIASGFKNVNGQLQFESTGLSAQILARLRRHPGFFDYSLTSQMSVSYSAGSSGLRIRYYRPGGAGGRALARKR